MAAVIAEKLEERWTPTTIQATFVFRSPPCRGDGSISIDLPLPNLGWTFALSLIRRLTKKPSSVKQYGWFPATFSFSRDDNTLIPWRNTSMRAQLSLANEEHVNDGVSSTDAGVRTPDVNISSNSTLLCTMDVVLARNPSMQHRCAVSCTALLPRPTKVWLTVTISDCPFPDGLFQVGSSQVHNAEAQRRLVGHLGDRLLSRSLATGNFFDVKFLSFSTRSAPGGTGSPLSTYASLYVLEEHVNFSSAKLREEWTSVLAALNSRDNADVNHVGELSCPSDYDYELDSDFEDEDDASSPGEACVTSPLCERSPATLEGQQSESKIERPSSSLSSFELDGVSELGSVDHRPEQVVKGLGGPPDSPPAAVVDCERTVLVRFAAHRTWHAFLWYCYTGHLEFSKLKSQAEPGAQHLRVTHPEGKPPSCSPKSMYRLADLVGDNALKASALKAIGERMTEANILDEMFSVFTSKYPDVQQVQLGVLMKHCRSPGIKKAFLKMILRVGNMPHAEPVLSAFYDGFVARDRLPFS